MNQNRTPVVGGIGVPRLRLYAAEAGDGDGAPPGTLSVGVGGTLADTLRQAGNQGTEVELVGLVADDEFAPAMAKALRKDFPRARTIAGLVQTWAALASDQDYYGTPPAATIDELPVDFQRVVRSWPVALVAPMSAGNFALSEHILSLSEQALIMFSDEQLHDRQQSLDLMRSAGLTFLRADQLGLIRAEAADPFPTIQWLREEGVQNLLVICDSGMLGAIDGEWIHRTGFPGGQTAMAASGQHAFVGTVLAARAARKTWRQAIHLGLAANTISFEATPIPERPRAVHTTIGEQDNSRFSRWEKTTRLSAGPTLVLAFLYCVLGYLIGMAF